MLPENPVVFLMNADGIRNGQRAPAAIAQVRVQVRDVAQAVAPQLQAVGAHPHAVFAHVERILARLRGARIAVRHHHLCKRAAVQNAAISPAIAVTNMVDRQSLAPVKADEELPILPAHLTAFQRKACAFRLPDRERLNTRSQSTHTVRGVVARLRRQRPFAIFFDANHLHRVQIHHRPDAFDRTRITVIRRIRS